MSRRIIVHSLEQACAAVNAAAALDVAITLESAAGAGGYGGALWWKALVAAATRDHTGPPIGAVLDCGDEPGTALGALRAGLKRVRFTGSKAMREKLAQIAAELGAAIEGDSKEAALDLRDARDAARLCRDFLARNKTPD